MYKQCVQSEDYIPYLQAERDRWVINYRMQENWEAGFLEGKLNTMKIAIEEIYQRDDLDWLKELSLEQLEKGFKLVFKGLDYEQLKRIYQNKENH